MENIQLIVKRDEDYRLSIWELSRFLSKFNTYFYKYTILDEIQSEISKGTNPEDIFIIDGSFKVDNIYDKMGIINLNDSGSVKLLYIGKPIFLLPNLNNTLIFEAFKLVEEIRDKLSPYGFSKSASSTLLSIALNSNSVSEFSSAQIEMKEILTSAISEKSIEQAESQIATIFSNSNKRINTYLEKQEQISKLSAILANNPNSFSNDSTINEYFTLFRFYFNKVSRPLVYVRDASSNNCRLLVEGQVNKRQIDDNFVQLFDYKKVNPEFITLGVSVIGVPLVKKLLNSDSQKIADKEKQESTKLLIEKQKTELLKQEKLRHEIEALRYQNDKTKEGRMINNAYIKSEITYLESKLEEKTAELKNKHKFNIVEIYSNIDIKI